MLKILDCTLRDGGYYTGWNFDEDLVLRLVKSLDEAHVDIIELGYRSRRNEGTYSRCLEAELEFLPDLLYSELGFMIDLKDYKSCGVEMLQAIDDDVLPAKDSIFSWCRVATRLADLNEASEVVTLLCEKGYKVILNIMCVSYLTDADILSVAFDVKSLPVEALYVADSYGALSAEQICTFVDLLKSSYKPLGVHLHDNLGLAFHNAVTAIESGVEYIDATITGMGRGVGNVKLEQLIPWVMSARRDMTVDPLKNCMHDFQALQDQHGWGWSQGYMLSGMLNMHPFYCMKLKQKGYDDFAICKILEKIDPRFRHSFNDKHLRDVLTIHGTETAIVLIPARYESSRFPGKPLVDILGVPMVVRVAEIASQAVPKKNVYVATDSQKIKSVVMKAGFNVIMTSTDNLTGTDRVAEAASRLNANVIVSLQGDEPMLDPAIITDVIRAKIEHPQHVVNCMSGFSNMVYDSFRHKQWKDPKVPKVVVNLQNELLYASRTAIPGSKISTDTPPDEILRKQVCVYAFNRRQLALFQKQGLDRKTPLEDCEDIEINRFLELGIPVKMVEVTDQDTHAVDYPGDVKIIEHMMREKENA